MPLSHSRFILVVAAAYFWFSGRVRKTLTRPFVMVAQENPVEASKNLYRPGKLSFWRDLAIYFMVFAVVGHWMERIYSTFTRYFAVIYDPTAPLWQDYLSPFNIYGFGPKFCTQL